jgi:hypothetical protein
MDINNRPPANERLGATRAAQARAKSLIASLEAKRREALIAAQLEAAAVVDQELAGARASLALYSDGIRLLAPLAGQERHEAEMPNDAAACLRLAERLEERQRILQSKPRRDRSAADDHELENSIPRVALLRQRAEIFKGIEA